jgi:phytanoyl-CoA hydroxylase
MSHPALDVRLNDSQLRQFREEGYTQLGRVLTDSDLGELRREEARFRENARASGADMNQTLFFSQVCAYSEAVRRIGTAGEHLDAMEQLIGPNLMLWFTQFVTKMPDGNSGKSEFPWHQDNGYIAIEPPTNVTLWIALDDVDTENGCVWIIPRSHLKGLLPHRKKNADSWFLELKVEGDGEPAIMKAGEGVAFTGLTLHRSKLNHTNKARRAFFFEYCDPRSTAKDTGAGGAQGTPVIKREGTWVVRGQVPLQAQL